MFDAAVVRAALMLGPFVIGLGLWVARRPGYRARSGILFALLWNTVGLVAANTVAVRVGWWSFGVDGGLFLGVRHQKRQKLRHRRPVGGRPQ